MHYKFLTTELLTLELCALMAEFQHFILRFTKNFLTLQIQLREGKLLQRRVLLGSKFYGVCLPSLQWTCFMQLVKGTALSGSLSALWLTCFGLFACLDFGPCLFVSFLSLPWMLFLKNSLARFH